MPEMVSAFEELIKELNDHNKSHDSSVNCVLSDQPIIINGCIDTKNWEIKITVGTLFEEKYSTLETKQKNDLDIMNKLVHFLYSHEKGHHTYCPFDNTHIKRINAEIGKNSNNGNIHLISNIFADWITDACNYYENNDNLSGQGLLYLMDLCCRPGQVSDMDHIIYGVKQFIFLRKINSDYPVWGFDAWVKSISSEIKNTIFQCVQCLVGVELCPQPDEASLEALLTKDNNEIRKAFLDKTNGPRKVGKLPIFLMHI
ncbi:MAG: hypothetical protein HQM12_21070 [SAR324 cluster bacterium]|nr:hypothetical protein [SAR324 cluster bacterium]